MTRDLRKYVRQTNFRLAVGALVLLFFVGDGLIYVFYGPNAATMGLICLFSGLIPVAMIVFILFLIDWISKRVNRD